MTASEEKAEFCREMGASHVILLGQQDVIAEVRRLTDGQGVDLVFDHVGDEVWPISVECLRWGGRLVTCGATTGYDVAIDLRYLWNKQLSYIGSHIGTHTDWVESVSFSPGGQLLASGSNA